MTPPARRTPQSTLIGFLCALLAAGAVSGSARAGDAPPGTTLVFAALSVEAAEQLSVASSPDVDAATAVVAEDDAALAAARATLGPSAFTNYNLAPQGVGTSTVSQRLTSYGLQATLGDALAYGAQVAAADAALRGARAQRDAARLAERVKTAGLYFDALKARAVLAARRSALALAQEQARAAGVRFRAGDAPRLDVVRAEVAVAQASAELAAAGAADANATEALQVETGAAPQTFAATAPAAPDSGAEPPTAEAAVARALAARPEVRAARSSTAAAEAGVRAKGLAQLPAVNVQAGYATGIDSGIPVAGPQLAVNVSLPLSGAAGAAARQQAAVVAENRAKAAALERQIRLDVAAAARNAAAAHEASAATGRAREAAGAELAATQLGYTRGYTPSLEVASARDTYVRALVDELSARYDEAKARAVLALEIGP